MFIPWPDNPLFYVCLILQAPLVVYQDRKTFDLTAEHGGGTITRIEPLSVVLLFFLWLLLSPEILLENLKNPVRFIAIGLTISAVAYFASRIKKCEINASILKQMTPLICTTAIVSTLGKLSIDYAEFDSAVFVYVFVQSIMMFVCAAAFNTKNYAGQQASLFNKKQMLCSLALAAITLVTILSRVYAFRYVENPAYVNAIVLTAPFWVMLFYKIIKHEEKGDILSGVGIVLCAIALTCLVIW